MRVGTRLGLAEMIRGGTTTYCDMYYFEDAIADETAKAGVRGVLGETVIDFPVADNKTNAEAMAYVEKFVKRWQGQRSDRSGDCSARALHCFRRTPESRARVFRSHRRADRYPHLRNEKRSGRQPQSQRREPDRLSCAHWLSERSSDCRAHGLAHGEEIRSAEEGWRGRGSQSAIEHETRVGCRAGAEDVGGRPARWSGY